MLGSNARYDAALILGTLLGRTTAWLLAHGDAVLGDTDLMRYRAAVERRAAGEPVAYILGEAGFYGRTFTIAPEVLVPRPETEGLIALALETFPDRTRALRACDVGTGSGVLAITFAAEYPNARIVAIDISAAALAVAAHNAALHGVAERIDFRLTDARDLTGPFDVIVANLPYVRSGDLAPPPDPTSFEPRLALDGGTDGLAVYRPFVHDVPRALAPRGLLALEAGPDTAHNLAALVRAALGAAARVRVLSDAAGLPRIVVARRT